LRIFLWMGAVDAASQEAQAGGCSAALWLELAERRREHNPADALHIYQTRVDPTIERKKNNAYQERHHVHEAATTTTPPHPQNGMTVTSGEPHPMQPRRERQPRLVEIPSSSSARRPGKRSCFLGFRQSGASRSH
jgi:hypothetical protein